MAQENKKASKVRCDIGSRIGQVREKHGLTQADLASLIGESPRTVTHWENATRDIRTESLIKLSKALDVSADCLLGLSDMESPDKDLQWVHKTFGLSEKALSVLRASNSSQTAQSELQFINDLLSDREAIYFISAAYEEYKQMQRHEKHSKPSPIGDEPFIVTSRGSMIDMNEAKDKATFALFTCQNRFLNFIQKEEE